MRFISRAVMMLAVTGMAVAQAQSTAEDSTPVVPDTSDRYVGGLPSVQDAMPHITNDTREYCEELRHDIARIRGRLGELPAKPAMLAREGARLCQIGHFRPGIYRLRSALMMLRP